MHEALTWVCAILVIMLLVAGLLILSQRKVIDQLAGENAQLRAWLKPFNRDGKDGPGGSRKRGF